MRDLQIEVHLSTLDYCLVLGLYILGLGFWVGVWARVCRYIFLYPCTGIAR
jgi:hypothetical protein